MAPNDFTFERHGKDRYDRAVAVVYSEGVDVGTTLVREGHEAVAEVHEGYRPTRCGPTP